MALPVAINIEGRTKLSIARTSAPGGKDFELTNMWSTVWQNKW